jgi:hypothetical protein
VNKTEKVLRDRYTEHKHTNTVTSGGVKKNAAAKPGLVEHACNPSTWEAEAGGSQVPGQQDPVSKQQAKTLTRRTQRGQGPCDQVVWARPLGQSGINGGVGSHGLGDSSLLRAAGGEAGRSLLAIERSAQVLATGYGEGRGSERRVNRKRGPAVQKAGTCLLFTNVCQLTDSECSGDCEDQ